MYPSKNNNEQDNDELNRIQLQKNQTTNESLESTRNILRLAAESQEVGTNTMIMLDEQGEKLKRIENGVDNIHAEMTEAEENLTNLEKCCGLCVLPWRRVHRTYRPSGNSIPTFNDEKLSPITRKPKSNVSNDEEIPQSGYITRITNDDREAEMDNNLQLTSNYLGNLKNIALDMNDTLTTQNKQIGHIADKSEVEIQRVNAANKRAQDILRRA